MINKISPCLWFEDQGEAAAEFYVSIFKHSRITGIVRNPDIGEDAGTVLTVEFELEGQSFMALNGGPQFKFNEAVSLLVECETQEEVDYFWEKLREGGDPDAQQCGWLKDKFGLSWQIVPKRMLEMLKGPDPEKTKRAFQAMLQMEKLDLAALERAFDGIG